MNLRLCISALVLVACSPAPAPVSTSMNDPSNPRAPEGVAYTPPPEAAGAAPPADPHAGHGGDATSAPADGGVVYVCPMHPEVTSTQPGMSCPKCSMKLVPKK